jgi:hypothetical protein
MHNEHVLERVLWIGALVALANGHPAHLRGELGELAERMLRTFTPLARA